MKILNKISAFIFILAVVFACETDEDKLYSLDYVTAPTNVSAIFNITQDNTGIVTIIPNADGASSYRIDFGDGSEVEEYTQGQEAAHTYIEGVYQLSILAIGSTGLSTEFIQEVNVSFKAPENLKIVVENDLSISKKVNISATANYATVFDIYFGDVADEEPTSAMPDELISHLYEVAGDYEIRVIAKSAGAATTDSTFTFTVTEILAPVASAPTPPSRNVEDVISIYSSAYADIEGINYNPDWGQSGQGSSYGEFDLNGDKMLQYINLSYQGIALADGTSVDITGMEFLHMDVWTPDVTKLETSLISGTNGEKPVSSDLTAFEWTSIDLAISAFTDQGLTVADIIQLKLVGEPWAAGTVFVDNIYFYKAGSTSTGGLALPLDFESSSVEYAFTDFDGGAVTIIDNPQSSGINTSAKVAQMVKNAGQSWGGSFISLDNPIDFSAGKTFKMKVYSSRVGAKVLLKVENLTDGSINYEKEVETAVAGEWEDLSFDYTGINTSNSYQKIVLIFDNGTAGDGSADFTFLLDDIQLVDNSGGLSQIDLPVDFESSTVNYTVTDFGGNSTVLGADPADAGNMVAITTKVADAETWAGTTIGTDLGFASLVPLTATVTSMSVRVYSPVVGLQIRLKGEDHNDATLTVETEATTTVANAWEVLTFDFSNVVTGTNPYNAATNFDKFSIFFDFGNIGDDAIYYWDDVQFVN